jgi:diaminopimelate decarboxylase
MNDLIRPAMYGAHHDIVPVREAAPGRMWPFRRGRPGLRDRRYLPKGVDLPGLAAGDLVAFRSAGAYGAVMASNITRARWCPRCWCSGDHFAVIRPRPTLEEMLGRDTIPEWAYGRPGADRPRGGAGPETGQP